MKILIGSRALAFWNPSLKLKEDADWDVITDEVSVEHPLVEWHPADFLNNKDMMQYVTTAYVTLPNGSSAFVMGKVGLAIIKRSHLWRDLSFDKHITYFHKFGLSSVLQLHSDYPVVMNDLETRTKLTKEVFPQGNPNLMQTKEDFFDDAVVKKYDHDYLHELVAFYEKPLYNRLLRTPELAWCDEDKWLQLSHNDKLKCIAEETFVIAIERFMVPNDWNYPSKLAYMKALKKVCTTLCSGWFRDYAIDWYPQVLSLYNQDVFNKVKGVLK